jgi:hypothetical protein
LRLALFVAIEFGGERGEIVESAFLRGHPEPECAPKIYPRQILLSLTRRAVLRHGHTPASAFQSSSAEWGQSGQLTFNPATSSSAFSFRPHEGHKKRNSITQVLCLLSGMISNHPPKSKPKSALARKSQRSIRCPDGKNLVNPDFPDSLHKSMSLTCNGAA